MRLPSVSATTRDRVGVGVGMALEELEGAVDDARGGLRALGDIGGEALDVLVLEERLHALEQFRRGDAFFRQREEAVDDQRERDHRGEGEGNHHPARRGDHAQQRGVLADLRDRVVAGGLGQRGGEAASNAAGREKKSFHAYSHLVATAPCRHGLINL